MKKVLRYFIIYVLIVALPFLAFITAGECVPDRYENAFTTALVDKYHRLIEDNTPKIVFVGGSSLPFGLRSDLVEAELGRKAVDFGVYASLGTEMMMELSLANLNEGDVVVLAPELNAQTYSRYFNADVAWQAMGGERKMMRYLSLAEREDMAYNYMQYLYEKIRVSGSEGVPETELYSRTSFDRYGDIAYPREGNVMAGGYDKSQLVTLDFDTADFVAYVNEYAAKLRKKGVSLYFAFSPTNAAAVAYDAEESAAFLARIEEAVDCPILGTIEDFTYDQGYFYNTNYHLNDKGAVLHTVRLIDALKSALGIDTPTNIVVPTLDEGKQAETPVTGDVDPNEGYFTARNMGGAYYLTSIRPEFRDSTSLTLPVTVDGNPIVGIDGYCFAGCGALETLTIPENYRIFEVDCFAGCDNLSVIYLDVTSPGTTVIPTSGLFDGTAASLKVYVKAEAYTAYLSNYTWSTYKKYLEKQS